MFFNYIIPQNYKKSSRKSDIKNVHNFLRYGNEASLKYFFKRRQRNLHFSSLFAVQNKEMKRIIPQYCKKNNVHFVKHF